MAQPTGSAGIGAARRRLQPPLRAVKVGGAVFHTQGGLVVDDGARVVGSDGKAFAIFSPPAERPAASPQGSLGYLSGNGLLTAVGYGFIAGAGAAAADRPPA